MNKYVIGAVALLLLLPASFVVGYHSKKPDVIDLAKLQQIVKENSVPSFRPDAFEGVVSKCLDDYHDRYKGDRDHGWVATELEELMRKVVREAIAELQKAEQSIDNSLCCGDSCGCKCTLNPCVCPNANCKCPNCPVHCKGVYQWVQDANDSNLWLYGYWGKDGVFWYSYYMYTGQSVNQCGGWKWKRCR